MTLMISEVTLSPETVAAELRPVLLRLARELRKETEQLGITARQATLLWLVKRSPGLSLAELAAEEGISPPAMSGHVDRLERAGSSSACARATIVAASAFGSRRRASSSCAESVHAARPGSPIG